MIILEFLVVWIGCVLAALATLVGLLLWFGGVFYILGSKERFSEKYRGLEVLIRVILFIAWMLFPFSVVITLSI